MRLISIILLILTSAGLAFAQNQAAPRILTLTESIQFFEKNDLEILAAQKNLESVEKSVNQSQSRYFPDVKLEISMDKVDLEPGSTSSPNSLTQALKVNQNIFNGFSDSLNVSAAKNQVEIEKNKLSLTKASRVAYFKEVFISAVYNKKLKQLAERILQQRTENLKILELNFESGREHKGTLLLIQAYLEEAKFDLFQAEKNYQLALKDLSESLQLKENDPIDVSDQFDMEDPHGEINEQKITLELASYQIAILEEEAQVTSKKISQSNFSPSLDLYGKVYKEGPDTNQLSDHWIVGVTLTVPLFSGGKDYYNYQSKKLDVSAAQTNTVAKAKELASKARYLWGQWLVSSEKCKFNLAFQNAAFLRSVISRKKYSNGLITFDDWDDIENKLIDREKDYLKSLKDKWLAESDWIQFTTKAVK